MALLSILRFMKTSALFLSLSLILGTLCAQVSQVPSLDGPNSEYAGALHPQGKVLIFQSNQEGDWGLYVSQKDGDTWTAPTRIYENTPAGVFIGGPAFRADGKEIVFFSDLNREQGTTDIFHASFDLERMTFGEPIPFPAPINSEDYEAFPSISPDGKTLFFVRDLGQPVDRIDESDCYEIMMTTQQADGSWAEATALSFLSENGCVGYPRIMPDGETLIFSAATDSSLHDLFETRYLEGQWTEPEPIASLNSAVDDKMVSISYNGQLGFFSRSAGPYDEDMLMTFSGSLVEAVSGWAYVNASLTDPDGSPLDGTISILSPGKNTPSYTVPISGEEIIRLRTGSEYLLTFSAPDYDFVSLPVNFLSTMSPDTISLEGVLSALKKETTIRLDDLSFEYNSAEISDSAATILDIAAVFLAGNEVTVEIAAHTDDVGSPEFNQQLSGRRAASVVEALVARGIAADRLVPKGYGESQPIADNSTEEGKAQNRRVEFKILEE